MKLIIDISEKVYDEYMNLAKGRIPTYKACDIAYVLKNGIPLPTEIQALQQIRDIINFPVYIQEDVLKYQMICDILNMAERNE